MIALLALFIVQDPSPDGKKRRPTAPSYCRLCKLVFHQARDAHNESEMHKLITRFLNPMCEICDTQFFSPMAYERHNPYKDPVTPA